MPHTDLPIIKQVNFSGSLITIVAVPELQHFTKTENIMKIYVAYLEPKPADQDRPLIRGLPLLQDLISSGAPWS